VIPVAYGDGVADRIRAAAPGGVDAFIDTHGDGYVELALALGVTADRIDTIADYAAAQKHGVKTDGGRRLGWAPRYSPSWRAWSPADTSRCRSRTSTRWRRSARPTPSSNAAIPTARSSSGPSPA
jgi:hypothetical protein